jgi:hypothetical protein
MVSTISKILRNKEKYLFQDDGRLPSVKIAETKFIDVEQASANWARNYETQSIALTDAAIKEQARFSAATAGNAEFSNKANNTSLLEKFKLENGIDTGKPIGSDSTEPQEPRNGCSPGLLGPWAKLKASEMRDLTCTPFAAFKQETSEPDIKKEADLILSW